MDTSVLIGAAAACVAGGFFPWISSEVAVLAAAAVLEPARVPLLIGVCAAGQVSAKSVVYALTRWAPERLPERARNLLARAERFGGRRGWLGAAVLTSASVSVPPFYLVTLACGTLRLPYALFGPLAFLGTVARYGLLAWLTVGVRGGL